MTDEHFDQAFERMQTELNVTPSPEFLVKVRQQNEQTRHRSSWSVWAWAGATATCAAAVIAIAMWPSLAPEPQVQTGHNRLQASVSTVQKPQESLLPVQKPTPEAGLARAARVRSTPAPTVPATATETTLEVLVPPDQLIAIRQLMSSMRRDAGAQVAPPATLIDPDTGNLITPKPIEIPLIPVTPLPGDPEGRSGGRENR